MNARLAPGDWVVAHSSKGTGQRLIYAMRLTQVLSMDAYFVKFPDKQPDPNGNYENRCGDNLYYRNGEHWARLPSAEHNTRADFLKDRNRPVFIAEGSENYWYFGATSPMAELDCFADRFPWLIKNGKGVTYEKDVARINAFENWLTSLSQCGLIGTPRDRVHTTAHRYLVGIEPDDQWVERDVSQEMKGTSTKLGCGAKIPTTSLQGACPNPAITTDEVTMRNKVVVGCSLRK